MVRRSLTNSWNVLEGKRSEHKILLFLEHTETNKFKKHKTVGRPIKVETGLYRQKLGLRRGTTFQFWSHLL